MIPLTDTQLQERNEAIRARWKREGKPSYVNDEEKAASEVEQEEE
jgi:hypothetical protein